MGLRGRKPDEQRDSVIIGMFTRGMTYEEIADVYGVTRQRIQQITKRHGITREHGGYGLQALLRVAAKKEKKDAVKARKEQKTFEIYGCSAERVRELTGTYPNGYWARKSTIYPWAAYRMQRKNAIATGKGWEITFPEWWQVWQESGKWELRGRGQGYCMARYGDSDPYSLKNVYICTIGQNFSDSYLVNSARSRLWKNPKFLKAKGYHKRGNYFYIHAKEKPRGPFKTALAARRAFLKRRREKYGDLTQNPSHAV
jgi:hypothetical protein